MERRLGGKESLENEGGLAGPGRGLLFSLSMDQFIFY